MSEEEQFPEQEEFNKSYYDPILKEVQNGIKDKVITKFLSTIQQQSKELTELRKENILLKNQLTYILKRILLNKTDFNYNIIDGYISGKIKEKGKRKTELDFTRILWYKKLSILGGYHHGTETYRYSEYT